MLPSSQGERHCALVLLWPKGNTTALPSDFISITATGLENLSKAHPQLRKKINSKNSNNNKIGVSLSVLLVLHGMLIGSSESEEC